MLDRVLALRGTACTSNASLFQELAAVLQFPLYFGHNWAALHDCLYDHRANADLGRSWALVFTSASRVLESEPDDKLSILLGEMVELAVEVEAP